MLVPDLAGWRRERMPEVPDAAAFELPPDWVCEVLSASTAAMDRADKMPLYARAHVRHVWLIDPFSRPSRCTGYSRMRSARGERGLAGQSRSARGALRRHRARSLRALGAIVGSLTERTADACQRARDLPPNGRGSNLRVALSLIRN